MAKFRTVLLTLLIGNRTAASLLFFGLFFGIFVAQTDGVAADERAAVGARSDAPYSNNDKTSENGSENERRNEPLALGRRAFERAEEEAARRRFETTRPDGGVETGGETTPVPIATDETDGENGVSGVDALRVVRQNAYSGNVVFYELSNGLRVLLKKTTEARVGFRVVLRDAGALGEREAAGTGLARLTAALVVEEANARTAADAEGSGARLRGRVEREGTVFALDVAEDEFDAALERIVDAVWRSTFDEARFERAVRTARRRVEAASTERETLVENLTAETVYLASPYREPLDGRIERLEAATADDVRAFYASRYAPNRAILAIAGPFEPEAASAAIAALCVDVKRGAPFGTEPPSEPRQTSVRDAFVEGPGTTATFVLAWPTVERSDPDAAALDVLAELLSGGANGRLTRKVVDGEIPALDVAARSRLPFGVRGFFETRSTVAPENWPIVEAATRAELRRLAEEPIPDEELAAAKKRLETAAVLRERDPVASLERRATALAATGDPDFEARRAEAIRRVDAATAARVARERFGDVFSRIAVLPKGTAPRLVVPARFEPSPIRLTTKNFPNGLRVFVVDSADERLIDVRFVALAGALVETRETAGRTALLGELLDKGSRRFSRSEVARFFDSIGSRFEVEVGRDAISFGATVLKEDFEAAFEILLDAATDPAFDPEEFERAKTRRLAALARRSGSVDEALNETFAQAVPPESVFAVPSGGTTASVAATTLDELREFWRRVFSPQNLIVGLDGPLAETPAANDAIARLGAVPPDPTFQPIAFDRPSEPSQAIRRFKRIADATVGSALIAAPIPAASARNEIAALTVLQAIWEGSDGGGGRLGARFGRDFDGDCEFRVELAPGPTPSYMAIRWTTEPKMLPEATRRVAGVIAASLKSSISEEECRRAKKQIILRRKSRYVALQERTLRLIFDEFYRVAPETDAANRELEFDEAIVRTTAADVARVAQKYWGRDLDVLAIVSPAPYPGISDAASGDASGTRN